MLIDGEKFACDACVRGHRVSNCQHADRPLQHIAKKGRPVSQCAHCRTLRKSRSAHVKCECGEKAHAKGACPHLTKDSDPKDTCCCSHGGRCACSLKKEHLDTVPESDSDECAAVPKLHTTRPRAHTVQSEGSGLTVFNNGHHKPAHKHNQMAHKCGLPYVVPRAHSIHGTSPAGLANRSVDNLPHTNTIDALHADSHIKDSMVSAQAQQRLVKSEHNSPVLAPTSNFEQLNAQIPPLDLSLLENYDYSNYPSSYDGFGSLAEVDQPIFSAGLSASVDWSHYHGLDFNNNYTTSEFSQAPSFSGFEFSSIDQPALTTTSTSGEISEIEDFGPFSDAKITAGFPSRHYGSDASDGGEDNYRLSTASSYMNMPQAQMLAGDIGSTSIDDFLEGRVDYGNVNIANQSSASLNYKSVSSFGSNLFGAIPDGEESLWMADYTNAGPPRATQLAPERQENHAWVPS